MSIGLVEKPQADDVGKAGPAPRGGDSRRPRLATRVMRLPASVATARWTFRTLLNVRRRWRAVARRFQRRWLRTHPLTEQVNWRWYRFRFRFARLHALRRAQFLVRERVGGRRATVPTDKLLVGGWNGMSGYRFALRSGITLDPSTRLGDSFYTELLDDHDRAGDAARSDEHLRGSGYYRRISVAAALSGHYRGERDPAGLTQVAREYLDRYQGRPVPYRPGRSVPGTHPQVRPIEGSDCYQVLDGHHRLAMAIHHGVREAEVLVTSGTAITYAQQLLLDMSWLDGSPRLYQPVGFPEVQTWPLLRRCTDRMAMMAAHLGAVGLRSADGAPLRALDVGACYGWFVDAFAELGFDAHGIELDPLARELAPLAYGLDPERIAVGDCLALLADDAQTADVVTCFSLLHHFVMGRGTSSPEALMRALDVRTREVLFLDTGQAHESWFRFTLPEWTPEYIARWIREHSSFTRVEALGVDGDGVGRFRDRFGRTLFACRR
jgi:Methyltransferase domain